MIQKDKNLSALDLIQMSEDGALPPKILVVDDDPLVLALLEEILKREDYRITTAENGKIAVEKLHEEEFSVIICDQCMPELTGIEVLQEAQKLQPDTIRILLTGNSDSELAIQAINVGKVHHYVTKPWEEESLKKMIKNLTERYQLEKENQALQRLIIKQHNKLAENHELLVNELQLGARIQESLLLGRIPKDLKGVEIAAMSLPSKDIDGDFFDFYRPADEVFDLAVGDVMGKGIASALVGTTVKTQLLRFAMAFTLPKVCEQRTPWKDDVLSPKEVINEVHDAIAKELIALEYFVTLFYGRFYLKNRLFTYIDCGSAKPIHYRRKEKRCVLLQGENFPLGVLEDTTYTAKQTSYDIGDLFLFYSDGVSEAKTADNELFGVDRLIRIVQENVSELSVEELMEKIRQNVLEFSGKEELDDDLTLIVVRAVNQEAFETEETNMATYRNELSQLDAVRTFVGRLCHDVPGDAKRYCSKLQVAVNEAFSNIVIHGYEKDEKGQIVIKIMREDDGITVEISDQGKPVDPSRIREPDLAGNRFGGFGWYLIREIADRVEYSSKQSESGWNHLVLYKKFITTEEKMKLGHKKENEILIITPETENLDARDAPEFKKQVIELINENAVRKVIIDLNRLQFIDSSGLGSFLSVLKTLNTQGGDLRLSCMNSPIRTMFELVAMHKIFDIFTTNEEAMKSFK